MENYFRAEISFKVTSKEQRIMLLSKHANGKQSYFR
jgi:hypothetical protein